MDVLPEGILLNKHLSTEEAEQYTRLGTSDERRGFIAKALGIDENNGEREKIIVDFCFYNMQFCMEHSFAPDKLSTFFSIGFELHDAAMKNFWPLPYAFQKLKESVARHSVQRPPWSIGVFSADDADAIMAHMAGTYFRHYMLYKFAFTKRTVLDFSSTFSFTEEPVAFPALAEARTEEEVIKEVEEMRAAVESAAPLAEDAEALADVPEDVKGVVVEKVNAEVARVREAMEAEFKQKEADLVARIAELQKGIK